MIGMQKRIAMAIQETAHKLAIERDGSGAVRLSDEEALRLARSCLSAMREPTEAMLVLTHPRHLARLNWQAMIDEALK